MKNVDAKISQARHETNLPGGLVFPTSDVLRSCRTLPVGFARQYQALRPNLSPRRRNSRPVVRAFLQTAHRSRFVYHLARARSLRSRPNAAGLPLRIYLSHSMSE